MKLSNNEMKILSELYMSKNRKLEEFTLFKRLKLTFSSIHKSIIKLTHNGLIEEIDISIRITEKGLKWITSSKKYSSNKCKKSWMEIPSNFKQHQLDVNSFYIPNIKLLDEKLRKDMIE